MGGFGYDNEVLSRFPATVGAVLHATGLDNGPTPASLHEAFTEEQGRVKSEIGDTPLSEIPSLAAWRRTFRAFGVKPTQYRSAPEALLRRLTKQGNLPSINLLVDLANLVSIRHRLPVAVFDQAEVTGETTVRFASGDERFTDLGTGAATPPDQGEVVFVDEADLVSARRWCWRQSAESAASPTTVEAVITIEGQHENAGDDVTRALTSMNTLLSRFQREAVVTSAVLSTDQPKFPF